MDKNQNCLSCFYEPEWSAPSGNYQRRHGKCKWTPPAMILPAVFSITNMGCMRYDDDSGLPVGCKAWKPKQQQGGVK